MQHKPTKTGGNHTEVHKFNGDHVMDVVIADGSNAIVLESWSIDETWTARLVDRVIENYTHLENEVHGKRR